MRTILVFVFFLCSFSLASEIYAQLLARDEVYPFHKNLNPGGLNFDIYPYSRTPENEVKAFLRYWELPYGPKYVSAYERLSFDPDWATRNATYVANQGWTFPPPPSDLYMDLTGSGSYPRIDPLASARGYLFGSGYFNLGEGGASSSDPDYEDSRGANHRVRSWFRDVAENVGGEVAFIWAETASGTKIYKASPAGYSGPWIPATNEEILAEGLPLPTGNGETIRFALTTQTDNSGRNLNLVEQSSEHQHWLEYRGSYTLGNVPLIYSKGVGNFEGISYGGAFVKKPDGTFIPLRYYYEALNGDFKIIPFNYGTMPSVTNPPVIELFL